MTAEEDTSYTKLPIEERCVHKLWKARISGYEEAIKIFGQLDEKAPEWNKFTGIVKKFVIDSNAVAQEKGLEATLVFVENSATAGRTVGEVMTGLITKCYGAPKAKTKDVAIQITLMFIEIEKQDIVIEELVKGMDHKFPKIVSTCIKAATQAIKEFGSKVLNIKLLLKKLQSILEDRDKSVRDEAKLLAIEIYSWIGPTPVKANLANLKPLQIQELEAEFEKISSDKPRASRFLRSQQEQAAKMEEVAAANGDMILEEGTDTVDDPEEHIDPVNILSQLSKDFYEKLEAKKWQERKEAMDTLEGILSKSPKLESGEYGDLVRALKKIITKDSNVIIVGIAAKCMAMLANGLKKRFETYASACIPALLEKFKEKKQNVVLPLRDAVDAIYLSMTLESIHEDILTAIDNKNPSVKAESVSFLTRCFSKCTPTILNKKYLKIFTTALIKTLNESDPTVRDNSAEALGTAWKVVSEKNILPFLTTVDAIKLAKIKEASEKAVITAKPTNIIRESKSAAASSNMGEKKATVTINKNTVIRRTRTAVNIPSKTVANSKTKKPMSAPGGRKPAQSKALPPIETENEIGDEELEELALTFCSPEILNGMVDANWKTRLSNVQEFSQIIDQMESLSVSSQVLIKLLNKKPGIKDNNVQIQKLRLECLKKVIEKFPITSTGMNSCIQDVSSLLGDNKNGTLASQVLTTLAESTRLDLVCNAVLEYAFTVQKNPKVQIDALNWLSGAILEFGFIIEPKSVMQNVKKAVSASNPQVRLAVISLLGVMYLYMGPQLSLFFENEKPTLVQQINAEFEKHQGEAPPKPTRGKNMNGSTESLEAASDDEKPAYEVNIRDIVPRVDISPQITDALINELSDKDWKVRSDALTKLQNIVNEAKFITSELGEARKALQDRISDSNARLGSNAINLVELISKAMGSSFKNYIKGYLPGVLNALGDPKTFKCQSARQCMNTWADVCGYREFFGGDILLDALKNNSVTLRSELWTWLAEKLPLIPSKSIPADELKCLLLVLYTSLEDRNASVRSASEKAVLGFMMHLGYASMYGACEKLKPMSVKFCREKLDKERPNLPVVPIEKPKVVKSGIPAGSSVKSGGSKIPPPKAATKANKENVIPRVSTATGKKKEEVDNGPLFQRNNLKHQRDIDEHKLKSLKWNFTTPREEFVEQLREQMLTAGINKVLITNMFHSDFRYHLKAIEILSEDLNTADDGNVALISNLDLILKWMTLRFFDTNPSVLLKGLDYLQHIFDILMTQKYTLHDTEASSFVPYLVTKLGDPKDTVRSNVRAILKQIAFIFPNTKMFQYIMDGVKSKNSRQRSECLEHLATMIEDYGTSICQPSVAAACKEIAKSIGDRDNSVRTAALNCFVAAFFLHGEALFKFVGNISEKDMGLLRERLKRASKNRAVPVATVQPTIKMVVPPVQQVPNTEDIVDDEYNSDEEEHNATFNVSQESNHISSPQRYSSDSPSRSASTLSYRTGGSIPTAMEHSSALRMGFRRPVSEVYDEPQVTRYALDEKFIKELEAEEISKPELKLKSYNWNTDHDEVKFKKRIQDHTQSLPDNMSSSKPCVNVSPYSTATITKSPKTPPAPIPDPIQQLINQVTSQNIEISKTALTSLDKMLLRPDMRSKFLEGGKVLSLFYAIIKQFNVLSESHDIDVTVGYKNIFNLCLNLYKYQEFTLILNEQIVRDLLSKLLYLLSMKGPENSTDTQLFGRCVNSLIMNVLERSAHTPVTCALLAMLYDTVKSPQNSSTHYKELVMKCIWKIVKDFQEWGDELCYERVLAHIHRFLKEFDSKHWKKQPSDTPLRTCKTVLHTMVKIRSDKVLESLDSPEFPKDSEMVVYIHKLLRHLNSEPRPESSKRKHRTPYDELSEIFQLIGQHENTDEGIQQLHRFKIKHPNIDIEPHISKTTKYFQDYIHRKLSAIEDNLKSCLVEPNGNNDSLKPITSLPIRKPESASASEADGFMKRLQILKMKASREETFGASNGECNGNNRLDEDSQDEDLPMLNTSRSPRK